MIRFILPLAVILLPGCSKTYKSCQAQVAFGADAGGDPCSGDPKPSEDASGLAGFGPDAKSIEVKPWICEGKAKPWCHQGSATIFTKVYPKMDTATCEILDATTNNEVAMEKCAIPEADLLEVKKLFPEGLEILGLQKGMAEDGTPLYRVTYRQGFGGMMQIFDSKGKSLPLDTPMNPDEWISEALRKDFKNSTLDTKEKRFQGMLKEGFSQKEIPAKMTKVRTLLQPYISAEDFEALKDMSSQSTFEFTTQYGKLKKLLPELKSYLSLLDKAAIGCADGYPMFCRKQPDGSYKYDEPIRIETDECPIYQAPKDAVDDSFCLP